MAVWTSRLVGVTLASLIALVPSQVSASELPFLTNGAVIDAPRGFIDMCHHDRTFCGAASATSASAEADDDVGSPRATLYGEGTGSLANPASSAWSGDHAARSQRMRAIDAVLTKSNASYPVLFAANAASRSELEDQELLQRVNRIVNDRVAQKTDEEVYGQAELWHRSGVGPRAAGDCEDIAIEKRFQLIDAGFDPKRLFFAVVFLPQAGLHTVLVARMPDADVVLDSRTPYVNQWDKTSYSWIAIQSPEDPMVWHSVIKNAAAAAVNIASAS